MGLVRRERHMRETAAASRSPELALSRPALARSRRYAFWLMLAGAALEVVAAIVAVRTASSLVPSFASHDSSDARVIAVAHGRTLLLQDIVAAIVWAVMAFLNRSAPGDGPRIFSVVLFCMGTNLSWQYLHDPNSRLTLVVTVVIWLVGLAVVTLLFSDLSSGLTRVFRYRLAPARKRRAS